LPELKIQSTDEQHVAVRLALKGSTSPSAISVGKEVGKSCHNLFFKNRFKRFIASNYCEIEIV
jgi:hypothetical protein